MPTPRSMDDVPITGGTGTGDRISVLQYLEARIKDQKDHSGLEIQTLRETILRISLDFDQKLAQRDVMAQQRFDASQQALSAAMLAAEKAINAALTSAAGAVLKAEVANERRFECVSADTPIMCADLVWRTAGSLRVGDELIALDEQTTTRSGRRFRRAVVTANEIKQDHLLQVNTTCGSVRCNPQHPWLVCRHSWQWASAAEIKVGEQVSHPLDVWDVDTSWEAGWLAGMFDGEGCLSTGVSCGKGRLQLSLSQRESPTSDKICKVLTERLGKEPLIYRYEPGTSSTPNNTQPFFHFLIVRRPDVLKILGSTRPPRLLARASEAWDGRVVAGDKRYAIVTSVEAAGVGDIAALSTSTQTYIAAGFAMHNSVNEFRKTLSDQTGSFIPRAEATARFDSLSEKLDAVIGRLDKRDGTGTGLSAGWAILVSVIGVLGTIIGAVILLSRSTT